MSNGWHPFGMSKRPADKLTSQKFVIPSVLSVSSVVNALSASIGIPSSDSPIPCPGSPSCIKERILTLPR